MPLKKEDSNYRVGFRILQYSDRDPSSFKNPLCIIGMPGVGDVGKFAVDQLIGILNAEKYYEIISFDYPAGAIIDNSILSAPKAEILTYYDKRTDRDIILITSDAQAMTPKGIYEISDLIAELVNQFGVTEIVALSAIPTNKKSDDNISIYITSTEDFNIKEYIGCNTITKGVIIGSNGLIPSLAKARFGINGKVFLVEIFNKNYGGEGVTDLKASIVLLDRIAKLYNLPIEPIFSDEKVSELSKDLEEKRKKLEEELESIQDPESSADQEKTIYI
ncbi:MAG: PAC2 family protein [Promethearchaeota archaeon]